MLSVFNSAQYTVSAQMMLVLVTQPKYRPTDLLLSSVIALITRAVTDLCMCLNSTKLCSPLRFSPGAVPSMQGLPLCGYPLQPGGIPTAFKVFRTEPRCFSLTLGILGPQLLPLCGSNLTFLPDSLLPPPFCPCLAYRPWSMPLVSSLSLLTM